MLMTKLVTQLVFRSEEIKLSYWESVRKAAIENSIVVAENRHEVEEHSYPRSQQETSH